MIHGNVSVRERPLAFCPPINPAVRLDLRCCALNYTLAWQWNGSYEMRSKVTPPNNNRNSIAVPIVVHGQSKSSMTN